MRILYIDIDSLRPDHLGCYGYHRATSPNIDAIAAQGVRFDNLYITDAPCLPSRTALWSGRCGFRNGVVAHGGTAASPFNEGIARGFRDSFGSSSWMVALRQAGFKTATVSSFGERHAAWHWYAGFNEIYNPGRRGLESADTVVPIAMDWLERNAQQDNWFLHVNLWDPHTPYRAPTDFGNPFKDDPLPAWMTEEVWHKLYAGYGPHSPQEANGFGHENVSALFPTHLDSIDTYDDVRYWFDGYDTGINYADMWLGRLFNALADHNILEDTVIMISADHGENQGELNIWGDHHTADDITCRVPLIVKFPDIVTEQRVDSALHYHFDWAATLIELAGGKVPTDWDGQAFTEAFKNGTDSGREYLVTSQGAWACQRGVRFQYESQPYMLLETYHDGHKDFAPIMLFNLASDPHQQINLAPDQPAITNHALGLLAEWKREMMDKSATDSDPLMTVLREGGPFHTRGELPAYLDRLRNTGREHHATALAMRHPTEL
ncbi:MAG: sulfatase [Aggregatilineales bacterium]